MDSTLVIIPSFNERENIVPLIEAILGLYPYIEVLVVDDSSPDGTADAVRGAQAAHGDRLHLIVRSGKGGRGSAVLEGFRYGLGKGFDFLIEMDADFSHRPEEIAPLLAASKATGCAIGSRYLPQSEIHEWTRKRTFFSGVANRFARFVLGIPITDYTNGFRCYSRVAIERLDLDGIDAKGYVVLSEVAYQLHNKGMSFREIPTIFVNRRRGISNLSFKEIREAFLSVLRIRFPHLMQHVDQAFKFGLAGATGAVVDLGTLELLVRFASMRPEIAGMVSSGLALLCVFLINKFYAFKHRAGRTHVQALKFGIVYAIAIVLNYGIFLLFFRFGVQYLLAKVFAIGIVMFFNYFMLHSFVFRES